MTTTNELNMSLQSRRCCRRSRRALLTTPLYKKMRHGESNCRINYNSDVARSIGCSYQCRVQVPVARLMLLRYTSWVLLTYRRIPAMMPVCWWSTYVQTFCSSSYAISALLCSPMTPLFHLMKSRDRGVTQMSKRPGNCRSNQRQRSSLVGCRGVQGC